MGAFRSVRLRRTCGALRLRLEANQNKKHSASFAPLR
jgi:hypothetical protein